MPVGAARTKQGTVNAAIVGYYDSMMFFGSLAPSTQAIRRQILERFRTDHGDKPIALLPKKFIVLTIGKLKPSVAINWLSAIRHLMQYGVSANMCEVDPTQGIKLKTSKSDGIYTWREQDIAAYEAAHGVGTKARLALALGLYTGQRRGDMFFEWGANIFATEYFPSSNRRPESSCAFRFTLTCAPSSMRRRAII